jgi:probable HAF family extracellular repeat protein
MKIFAPRVLNSVVAVFLFTLATLTPSSAYGYAITDLGDGGALAINNAGTVVGFTQGSAFVYQGGVVSLITVPGATNSMARDINNAGDIVGTYGTDVLKERGFLYTKGSVTDIGSLGGKETQPNGINDRGVVVGGSAIPPPSDQGPGQVHAFVLQDGVMQDIGAHTGGFLSFAYAINATGQIVGSSSSPGAFSPGHAFLYSDGLMVDIGTLGGTESFALAMNDRGDVVGASTVNTTFDLHPFLFTNGSMVNLGARGIGRGINNAGLIVGDAAFCDALGQCHGHAFLYRDGHLLDLNTLIHDPRWTLLTAFDINDRGQIVGYGLLDGQQHGFLLTPVPLPGTLILTVAAMGIIGTPLLRRRRGKQGSGKPHIS